MTNPTIIYDTTCNGLPRYTHATTGETCLRQLWMSDIKWEQTRLTFLNRFPDGEVQVHGTTQRIPIADWLQNPHSGKD